MTEKSVFPVDRNHVGIRLVVLLTLFIMGGLGLFVIMPLLTDLLQVDAFPQLCTSGLGALGLAVGSSWAVENLLLRIWPSGKSIVLDNEQIELTKGTSKTIIRWAEPVDMTTWYFVIDRGRTWIPKGWYCAACRLTQGEQAITPYTFVKPEEAQKSPYWSTFATLLPRRHPPKDADEQLLQKVAAQEPLRHAERDRWENGVEMTPTDFFALLQSVDHNVPAWPAPPETD